MNHFLYKNEKFQVETALSELALVSMCGEWETRRLLVVARFFNVASMRNNPCRGGMFVHETKQKMLRVITNSQTRRIGLGVLSGLALANFCADVLREHVGTEFNQGFCVFWKTIFKVVRHHNRLTGNLVGVTLIFLMIFRQALN